MNKFGIGQAVRRVEDQRFLTGRGHYVDDFSLPHQCYGIVVMSPHAHAKIKRVDVSAAKAMDGVLAVLTGADAIADKLGGFPPLFTPEDMGGPKGYKTVRPVLIADRVRCVGDRVAFVVAETLVQARDAADAVVVNYEPLPSVVNLEAAVSDGAPKIWDDCPTGNVASGLMFGNKEATDAVFAKARHVVKVELLNNRVSANSMEPRTSIGDYNAADDTYTLYASSQNPHGMKTLLSTAVFHEPETKFRVIAPDVGGGFGMKADSYPDDALVLWASRRIGRPVKWVASRNESLLGDNHGRDQVIRGELAVDENGKILALRAHALHALGAYIAGAAYAPIVFSMRFIPLVYDIQTIHISTKAVFTNTSPLGPYRGAGRPEATYLTERLMDKAADAAGIDRVEIRRRNVIPTAKLPYATPTGFVYDSGEFERCMDIALGLSDPKGFAQRRSESEKKGRLRGRGYCFFIEQGGVFNDRMELRFDPGGTVTIVAGTHSHGQGHATTYGQMVTEWLGVPFESIRFVQGDTDAVPFGRGTYAARSSMVGGCALKNAADAIVEKARPMAAFLMEASAADIEFKDGHFRVVGTDKAMSMTDVARGFYRPMGLPKEFSVGLEASGSFATEPPNFPNGFHACEVEIDPDTGAVTIDRYAAADDLGLIINPMICEGQIMGALAQGIGQALMEHVIYDPSTGQLVTGSFMDYGMPRADDIPEVHSEFFEVPAKTNPLGIKGIAESGSIGGPPAIIGAILDALKPLGVEHIDMPATPARVWAAINGAKGTAKAA
ncbi:MAG: molybdopterin-dependent oxidoreductase [Rhizobiales bacterium]|nr:molybdopterin-dependent oxidoreductase [Hyphomicrobiales bacterium]